MTTTYRDADAAKEIAERLIPEHHTHLKQARIVWLACNGGQSRARLCNSLLQHAFGKDSSGAFPAFVVTVSDQDWLARRRGNAREAFVDTLLSSMDRISNADTGKDRWAIAKPDVSLYLAVVKRHGLSTTEEQQVGKLIKDLPEQLAMEMDGDEDESDDGEPVRDGWETAPSAPAVFGDSGNGESADPTREEDWETVTRPDVSPEALSRIRGSVEAAVK